MALSPFANKINEKKQQETVEKVMKVIARWYVYKDKEPSAQQKYALGRLVCELYRIPRSDIHEAREEFRKEDLEEQRETKDLEAGFMLEYWKSKAVDGFEYNDQVILRMDARDDDFVLVCAKEIAENNDVLWTDLLEISKKQTPKTFDKAKKTLGRRSYN